jgi:hypothetical protein
MAYGVSPPVTSGTTYVFSFWARAANTQSVGKALNFSAHTSAGWSLTKIEGPSSFKDCNWYKFAYRGIAPNTGGTSLYFPFTKCGTIDIAEIQVEALSFPTPFTITSRSTSSLEYNFYNSIGMNWGGNWTIIYWKKPIATHNNALTGYSLDSLGCNSNSVGGGYIWWGKNSGSDTISGSDIGTIVPSEYFNHWHMISLSKSGTTLTITEWGIGGKNYIRTTSVSSTAANYYVTQHGYDFKLAGWDNANACNAYYKNLFIIPGTALSSIQLENIYRTQIKQKNGLQIQGKLIEGMVF